MYKQAYDVADTTSVKGWPTDVDPDAPITIAIEVGLAKGPQPTLALFRVLTIGDRIIAGSAVWATTYPTIGAAETRLEWLRAHPEERASIARRVPLTGDAGAIAEIEVGIERDRVRKEMEAAAREEREALDRHRDEMEAEKARVIGSYVIEKKGQFGLDLRRGDARHGFYEILFRERWERERFRDWFRWQYHRFADWAEFLDSHEAIELDRILLAEMLETERRIKAEGLSAGGRRPLRFWRGEAA